MQKHNTMQCETKARSICGGLHALLLKPVLVLLWCLQPVNINTREQWHAKETCVMWHNARAMYCKQWVWSGMRLVGPVKVQLVVMSSRGDCLVLFETGLVPHGADLGRN